MSYVFWLSLGLILTVSEFFVPGFVIIFFGAGAFLTGVLKLLIPGLGDAAALLVFSLSSIVSLVLFRKTWIGGKVVRDANSPQTGDADESCVGRKVSVVEPVAPGKPGKVELNGVNWSAESDEAIPAGVFAVVTGRDGLTLRVKPVG